MDRRDFLWVVSAAGVGAASAASSGLLAPGAAQSPLIGDAGNKRALIARPIASQSSRGALPFALAKFAEDNAKVIGQQRSAAQPLAQLSPLKEVSFHGFANRATGAHEDDQIFVAAMHRANDGAMMRHDLWSHGPKRSGGTSPSVLFTAHDNAFAGFEITHVPKTGTSTQAFFPFAANGGPIMTPGIYVLAGPRAATGLPPELGRYGYTGDIHAPVRESRLLGKDFAYISFVVHGEWV
jgi:hypothetical protein